MTLYWLTFHLTIVLAHSGSECRYDVAYKNSAAYSNEWLKER